MNENSTVQLFQPTIDYHLDSLGNSWVPSCDEERVVEYYDTTHSNNKDEIDKKLSDNNLSSQKKKRKKDYCYNWDSIIKHLKGYKISKVGEYKASMKSFGGAKIRCIKDHMKP